MKEQTKQNADHQELIESLKLNYTIDDVQHRLFENDSTLRGELTTHLATFHSDAKVVDQAVAYIFEFRQENSPRFHHRWVLRLDWLCLPWLTCFACRFYLDPPYDFMMGDTDGIFRFELSGEDGFRTRSGMFREPLTPLQVCGPEPPIPEPEQERTAPQFGRSQ